MIGPAGGARTPDFDRPTLIVSWKGDAADLGARVTRYLNGKLGNQSFDEIPPDDFFPFEGVAIENDVVQFPECRFYAGSRRDVVIFETTPPRFDWYRFLNLALDTAVQRCHVREVYAIGAMGSLSLYATPRDMLANFNSAEMKESVAGYDLSATLNYETPPGQRPTLNSFLLWAAQRRKLPAATLWVPVPFYLMGGDPRAQLRLLEFFNRKLALQLSFDDLQDKVLQQDNAIAGARQRSPELDASFKKVEAGESLSPEESERLAEEVDRSLRASRQA